jgi:hypothetical protein
MRQTISAVVEHTTKEALEDRARQDGVPLSRYVRNVLENHVRTPFVSKAQLIAQMEQMFEEE